MHVLIVEDNLVESSVSRLSLQKRGIGVTVAASLEQAVKELRDHERTEHDLDVILLDLTLPDSMGVETFFKIRSVASGIPIVILTGLDDQSTALEVLKHGAQDYLIKGVVSIDSVLRCLHYAIERNKVEVALRKSERRLRIILENSYDAFISVDSGWRITDWNLQAEKTFGWKRTEVLGRSLAWIVPHHLRKQYARDIEDYFAQHPDSVLRKTRELTAAHKDGHEFPIEIGIFRIKEDNNYMFCTFVRDITERRVASESLERAVQERTTELIVSNEQLKQFAKIASHDLQEPLCAVQGFVKLLADNLEKAGSKEGDSAMDRARMNADNKEFLAFILDGTQRMQTLIESVLLHSSIKPEESDDVATDCNSVIEEVLVNLDASIKKNDVHVEVYELPTVAVERSQLVQLFQNLLSNAIKYRKEETPVIVISAERTVDDWLFSVRDNGIGIDSQYTEKIFDMFARLHGRTKYAGTGMGLAICKKIVNTHNGRIWVESELGQGSIFMFTLPAAKFSKENNDGQLD